MQSMFSAVPDLLQSAEWPRRRACLLGLSAMAEGGGKKLYSRLTQVVEWVLAYFNDPHPKVRYAAIHVFGRLALDFSDEEKCGDDKVCCWKKDFGFTISAPANNSAWSSHRFKKLPFIPYFPP